MDSAASADNLRTSKHASRSVKHQHRRSPGSDDLLQQGQDQTPDCQGIPRQHLQAPRDVIMLDATDSEDGEDDHTQAAAHTRQHHPRTTAEASVAAAAARLAAQQQQAAARAAAAAAADAMTISDSEDAGDEDISSPEAPDQTDTQGTSSSSSSDEEEEPSTSSQQQQQQRQCSPSNTNTRGAGQQHNPAQQQQQQRRRSARQAARAAGQPPSRGRQQQPSSSTSGSDASGHSSGSSEEASSSGSESDDEMEQPVAHQRQHKKHAQAAAATAATGPAAQGTSTRKSSRMLQQAAAALKRVGSDGSKAAGGKSAPKAADTASHKPKSQAAAAAAAATPLRRPVRSCTQTPQRSTQAAPARTPGLSSPLGKLSLNSKAAEVPGSTARATRSSSRLVSCGPNKPSTAAAAAAAVTPGKQQRRLGSAPAAATPKGKAAGGASRSSVLKQVVVGGEVILPVDDVYLMQDEFEEGEEDEEETCEVCSSSKMSRANAMLECSSCLRGFHMRCLKPPLKKVPEEDWLCPSCNAGEPPAPPAKLVSYWQKLLYGRNQLAMVHVIGLQRGKSPEGEDEEQLRVRYYILPQDTHMGRQPHHAAREVFLGKQEYVEPACAVLGRAYVHPPAEFASAPEDEGNDVYLCEFEYDEAWKRFSKRRYGEPGPDELGGPSWGGPKTPAALRLTPSKAKGSAAAAGSSGGRRLFDDSSSSSSDGDYSCDSDDDGADDNYRPELHHMTGKGKGAVLSKRKRHGQLPGAAAAAKFVGLGAEDISRERGELKDVFAKLHASLSLGAVPDSLPCREQERQRLGGFLNRALTEDGGVLYICGVPGTGKTALVMEMLRGLRPQALEAGAQLVAINCLQLPTPQHVFSRLWEKLSGQHLGPARACEALMQHFGISGSGASKRRHYSTIIVLDEIDMLMTRDQAVLYQVFDWPNQPGSRLAVIGISNTHDLDQRVLPRIASRLDQAKLAFAPYSVAQLQTIVGQRLQDSGVAGAVEDMAVMLACRKVASETGDVRRALELLRRAVEIGRAEHLRSTVVARTAAAAAAKQPLPNDHDVVVEWQQGSAALVKRPHMTQAQQEMFGALHLQLLRSRSLWEKVLLVAVVVEARATGSNAVVIQSVAERASGSICSLVDLVPPPLGVLQHCLVKLASMRLLLSDGSHIKAQVALNVDKDDVAIAIKEDERLQALHQLL